jgi:hypothetical protein
MMIAYDLLVKYQLVSFLQDLNLCRLFNNKIFYQLS